MTTTTIGVVRETTPGERRVALVPDVAAQLRGAGMEVLIEASAGGPTPYGRWPLVAGPGTSSPACHEPPLQG